MVDSDDSDDIFRGVGVINQGKFTNILTNAAKTVTTEGDYTEAEAE